MPNAKKPMVLIYGTDPNAHLDTSAKHRERLVIATQDAAEGMRAARECRTWGAYATLCGREWDDFLDDHGGEVSELTGDDEPRRESPFKFTDVYGLYYVGDLLPEARTEAYEVLRRLVKGDPRLDGQLDWGGDSPAGHIACVAAVNENAVRLLERIIHEAGHPEYRFERDDQLIRIAMGF